MEAPLVPFLVFYVLPVYCLVVVFYLLPPSKFLVLLDKYRVCTILYVSSIVARAFPKTAKKIKLIF